MRIPHHSNKNNSNCSYSRIFYILLCIPLTILIINLYHATNSYKNIRIDSNNTNSAKDIIINKRNIDIGSTWKDTEAESLDDTTKIQANNQVVTKKKKIAYAITVTKDGNFVDGALVLGHSAKRVHDIKYGFNSEYEAELVAFVVPSITKSRVILQAYGWKILEKKLPVEISEIENEEYATKMKNSGCCGADEFLKLWAYTLTEYHRVVHLDMDSVIFQNMDELYSIDKEMLFTGDYNMKAGSPVPPAQGGFLVVRPSLERFKEYQAIIKKGDHGSKGWGGSGIGNFWGGQTIQGIVPYFYHSIHPDDGQLVNICVYNCMVDNPYKPHTEICLNGKQECQDCRLQKPELVKSAHFTICQKPWTCTEHLNPKNKVLCEVLHKKWFELRDEFEKETSVDTSYRVMTTRFKNSQGMCKRYGDAGYIPIPITKF